MTQPTPALIFDTLNAYQRTEALKAAIVLDLFSAIQEGYNTPAALAQRCHASEKGIRVLCDALTVWGLLLKKGAGYQNTPDGAFFLVKRSPAYIGNSLRFLYSDTIHQAYRNAEEAVRKGGTQLNEEGGSVSPENPVWVEFAEGMFGLAYPAARFIADLIHVENIKPCKVLDVAGGHGAYGIIQAQRNPEAHITILDWKSVVSVAQRNAEKFGVAERYRTLPGSAFEQDWGRDYDVILLTNFLHHFSPHSNMELLRKAFSALKENGVVAMVEFVPNEDRVTPPTTATFSFTMLCSTAEGDAYTFAEYQKMFRDAGFTRMEHHRMESSPQSVILVWK